MTHRLTLVLLLAAFAGRAQSDTAHNQEVHPVYERHNLMPSLSIGFVDNYRRDYSLPAGSAKGNTSGFAPVYARLDYALYKHISIAVAFAYDAFIYNYKQDYTGNNGPFTRYRNNTTRILSGGVIANYHLDKFIHIKNLDPFAGIGLSLNNIRYSAYPQGDTTAVKFDHTVTLYLKAGARYYISSQFSIYGDVGYDHQSIVSVGLSCRFFRRMRH